MQRESAYLLDMLLAARLALTYVSGKTKVEIIEDVQCQDAVVRRLEIIGEAARRMSAELRATLPDIPWVAMIGMRNVMIHDYDDVDLGVVRRTVTEPLPRLVEQL